MGTPTSSWRYADHSGELIPIITVGASSRQRPPASRTRSSFAAFQRGSESIRTPSRSKMTASGIAELTRRILTARVLGRLENDALARRAGQPGGVLERDRDAGADPAVQLQDAEVPRGEPDPERDLAARRDAEGAPRERDPLGRPAPAPDQHLLDALEARRAGQRRPRLEAEAEAALAIHPDRRPRAGEAGLRGRRRAARPGARRAAGRRRERSVGGGLTVGEDRIERLS